MKQKIIKLCIAITVITLALMFLLVKKDRNKYVNANVKVMDESTIVSSVYFRGNIFYEETYDIYIDSPAKITQLNINEGDMVNQGDELFSYISNDNEKNLINNSIIEVFEPFIDLKNSKKIYVDSETMEKNIKSPISGIVTRLDLEEGMGISSINPCVSISAPDKMCIYARVPEEFIQDIKIGMHCKITGNAFRNKEYSGEVIYIEPYATTSVSLSGEEETSVKVKISIDNPDEALHDGYSARVEILTLKRDNVLTMEYSAICQDENNIEYVYIYDNGIAARRNITTGVEMQDEVEITNGLKKGDIVILNTENIHEGTFIKLGAKNENL